MFKSTKRSIFISGILSAVFPIMLHTLPASAAKPKLPAWATEAIETVGREPVFYERSVDAEYLLREKIVTYGDDEAVEKNLDRRIVRILSAKGTVHGHDFAYGFDRKSKISSIKAWTLKPNGNVIELGRESIRETSRYSGFIDYDDVKIKVFSVPDVARGDLIVVEVETHYMHPVWSSGFSGEWRVQDRRPWIPTYLARFVLRHGPDWSYRYRLYDEYNHAGTYNEEGYTAWEWQHIRVPAGSMEIAASPQLRYVCSTEDPRWADRNRTSWDDLAALYHGLSKARLVPSDEMKQVVADLVENSTTQLEKIRAITNYVRESLTYVAVEIGIGGYQPRHVQNTFKNRYGDCKDMSSMIVSLLVEADITAYPALIRTYDDGIVDPDFPMDYFNHCIAYVPGVEETEDWIEAWPKHARFGRSLWIDATAKTASIEDMPSSIQGTYALVVTPGKGYLIETPVFGPERNVERRIGSATLSLGGDLGFKGEELFSGVYNIRTRARLKQGNDQDRQKWIRQYVGNRITRSDIGDFQHSDLGNLDEKLRIRYGFSVQRYANMAGNLMFFRPNIMILWKRNPFRYEQEVQHVTHVQPFMEMDSLTFELPPSFAVNDLPDAMDVETDFGSYRTTYTIVGNLLIYERKLTLKRREIPAESYAELKAFFDSVVKSDKAVVVLERRSAYPK